MKHNVVFRAFAVTLFGGFLSMMLGVAPVQAEPSDSLESHGQSFLPVYQGINDVDVTNLKPGDVVPGSQRVQPSVYREAQLVQYQYVSLDPRTQRKTVAVSSVLVPYAPYAGVRPTTIVADPYNSITQLSTASLKLATIGNYNSWHVVNGINSGSLVVVPDYLGTSGMYGATEPAGVNVLYATLAAQQLTGNLGSPTIGTGISGGSMALGRAAELQPEYAPDLDLVAVQLVATPANFDAVARHLNSTEGSGLFMFGAAVGTSRYYPQLAEHLTPGGRLLYSSLGLANVPLEVTVMAGLLGLRVETLVQDPEILDRPDVRTVIQDNNLGQARPNAKVMIVSPADDPWITPEENNLWLANRYQALGADVQVVTMDGLIWPSHLAVDPLTDRLLYEFANTVLPPESQVYVPANIAWSPVLTSPVLYGATHMLGDGLRGVSSVLGLISNPIATEVIRSADQAVVQVQQHNDSTASRAAQVDEVVEKTADDANVWTEQVASETKAQVRQVAPVEVADVVDQEVDRMLEAVNNGVVTAEQQLRNGVADLANQLQIQLPPGVVG